MDNPKTHPGVVTEYMASGIPFVTGTVLTLGNTSSINFPKVTRTISVFNTTPNTQLAVAFTQNGLKTNTANFFVLTGSNSYWQQDLRVTTLFLSSALGAPQAYVVAGLTQIPASLFPILTGSTTVDSAGNTISGPFLGVG